MAVLSEKWLSYPIDESTKYFFEKAAYDGLELRPGQLEMALEVCEAIKERKPLAVEAEVGIGKSYAYLVPAVMEYMKSHRQIIIATSTIALQEQLAKDAANVLKMTGLSIDITVAKGMRNYLCPKRLESAIKRQKDAAIFQDISSLMRSKGADRASIGINIPDKMWELVNVQNYGENCHNCKMKNDCEYYALRERLHNGNGIVICNQNMLVAHLQNISTGGRGIFDPNGSMVIIDEAHNLESKFREAFTTAFDCCELQNAVRHSISKIPKNRKAALEKFADDTIEYIEQLYRWLVRQVSEQRKANEADTSTYYLQKDKYTQELLRVIYNRLVWIENNSKTNLACAKEFVRNVFNTCDDNIVWLEMESRLKICVCRKEIRLMINKMLFRSGLTTILTSATISDKNEGEPIEKCRYFLHNIAFPVVGLVSEPKRSPFNYDENTMLYCSTKLPYPNKENRSLYREQSIAEIVRLLNVTHGKTLILFTAKEDMEYVYKKLSNKHLPYKILLQGKGSSQSRQLGKFRSDTNSVLLGTGTYWEGINIEGESLSQVIIFKLPFPVPDPIIDYKMSKAKDRVRDVAVPEMIIKLKQGAGRLIRSSTDKGIVSILDPRASTRENKPYRDTILNALCEKHSTEDIDELTAFWNKLNETKEAV
ncbi:ATP-dependent DNA helicase DinG [Ruminococcus sp. YE71]|uniref:ATP-dependent DNA helicase n=1 Tax=unclassified Ruminococcus TaxID=2608920 RepID=UPI000886132E|nr:MULTISPECIES: ATP-dependent DNA helicase [unclassified Ruminococcus]SDA29526.1 ATP-dependent DNA helicase DinG [Ruminococcus sp. YE78]SFW48432.1 ATP-dependent DNA helicase DinG [Ruminococcus sp. YE71]